MLVTLIGKKTIHKIVLPQTVIGNYWISDKNADKEQRLINIESKDGEWQITSNKNVRVISGSYKQTGDYEIKATRPEEEIIKQVTLKEYRMYYICIGEANDLFILYCSPVYETNFVHLNINNTKKISIGKEPDNHISYKLLFIGKKHAEISFTKGNWVLKNYDKMFGTFVNNKPVSSKVLSIGDVIFIMGLKIIFMGKSIFLNNPFDRVHFDSRSFSLIPDKIKNTDINIKPENDNDIEIYEDSDYFSRAPRLTSVIECEKVRIDAPPAKQKLEELPFFFLIVSMLSMGMMSMVSLFTAIDGLATGERTLKQALPQLVMGIGMLSSMLLVPMLNRRYQRKRKKKYEEERQSKYNEYLDNKTAFIDEIMLKQRKILFDNYLSSEECKGIVLEKDRRLWERKIEEHDFLTIRLGTGNMNLNIDIEYPEEKFMLEEDSLYNNLSNFTNKSKILKNVPITISLLEKRISALIASDNRNQIEKYLQSLIMQLITFHSYEDLKLVFLMNDNKGEKWDYVKMLPHIWNNTRDFRFFADDYNDMKEISMFLQEELQNRVVDEEQSKDYKDFTPYYLIITDNYRKVENLKIITDVLKSKQNVGFGILFISDNLMQLPNECKTFINLEGENGTILESERISKNQNQFLIDDFEAHYFDEVCKTIANIPIRYSSNKYLLPDHYTFMEMYDAGRIEQLNSLERWKANDSTLSLQAPIGVDSLGMPVVLDIHEKMHGPHGLIAGTTGSGKSEFIITYILSLAVNYHPDDVAFVLIDYKGGGLSGAFQKGKVKLPHLIGTITNIDTVELQRSLTSIQSELRRRQIAFNEVRDRLDEGTIDIYKYQKLYHEGLVDKPIPHLLIICDEFAELKTQQSEFMEELIRVARIGRSLGIHLILATQKPAGVVNDQIRSNSKFGICLKVQDVSDSKDVIKRPDAANLKQTGQFYLQVGNDEYFVLGQSAWAGAKYFPSDVIQKKVDTSICFISNTGKVIKKIDNTSREKVSNSGEQLTNIVRYLYELAKQEEIQTDQLWLDKIPETIYIEQLRKKYRVKTEYGNINPIIGEYDDPFNQHQGLLTLPISGEGNTIIFGSADSGKENLLSTIIYDTITTHTAEEVQLYLLDFDSESLKIFAESPHVGDVVLINEAEKISRFFEMIQKEARERKVILSEYNGDYDLYLKTSGKTMPEILVILNNYEAFAENYASEYDDVFLTMTREAIKYGIKFIITASSANSLRYRLGQNFKQKIALQLNSDDDYMLVIDNVKKKRPSNIFGRGLIKLDEIYEFQTAKICETKNWRDYITEVIQKLKETNKERAKSIPILPEVVTYEDVKEELKDISCVPIGIAKNNLSISTYDFTKDFMHIISSRDIEYCAKFAFYLAEEMSKLKNINITVLNAEEVTQNNVATFTDECMNLINTINIQYDTFLEGKNKESTDSNNKHTVCVIIGIDRFMNIIEKQEVDFIRTLKKATNIKNYTFIIVDSINKLQNHEYEEWYQRCIKNDNGIWVGDGIGEQHLMKVSKMDKTMAKSYGANFGYVIYKGKAVLVKLIGMQEEGDEYE